MKSYLPKAPGNIVVGGLAANCTDDQNKTLLEEMAPDEDMTLMHTTMIAAWNGVEEVQQGFPSQQGRPRLIRFESPRWRPKAIQVRVQFGVQE
jgi:hypothetical protein